MSRPLRITLVSLNVATESCRNYSLALEYLRLYARQDPELARRTAIATLNLNAGDRTVRQLFAILATRPRVVGFSCAIWNIQKVIKLARRIGKIAPWIRIVLGGQEVTRSQVDYLEKCPEVDVIVDGEGEATFADLIRAWLTRGLRAPLNDVPGIRWRPNGSTAATSPRPPIEPLDSIPSPYLDGAVRVRNDHHLGMMVETSRGCRFNCTFCFEGTKYKRVRYFSLDRFDREIRQGAKNGITYYHILDPILGNCDTDRLTRINEILRAHLSPMPEYRVSVEIYAELIKPEMVDSLDAFTTFDVGLQSINPVALKNIRRYFNRDKFVRGVRLLQSLGRTVNIYLIVGIPGETYCSFWSGVRFALAQKPDYVFFNHLLVLNGTRLREDAESLGLRFKSNPSYKAIETRELPRRSLQRAVLLSHSLMREYNVTIPRKKAS